MIKMTAKDIAQNISATGMRINEICPDLIDDRNIDNPLKFDVYISGYISGIATSDFYADLIVKEGVINTINDELVKTELARYCGVIGTEKFTLIKE